MESYAPQYYPDPPLFSVHDKVLVFLKPLFTETDEVEPGTITAIDEDGTIHVQTEIGILSLPLSRRRKLKKI
jgi:hypothetical protein